MITSYCIPHDLYRYDLEEPQNKWSSDYHNIEYVYEDASKELKFKNQIGAFFFYDDKSQARLTGEVGARRLKRNELWLTKTSLISDTPLLDLRMHYSNLGFPIPHTTPLQVICRLEEIGIKILNDSFHKYMNVYGEKIPFSDIRSKYEEIIILDNKDNTSLKEDLEKLKLAGDVNGFFNNRIGYLGQLLSDFSNGIHFKEMLISKGFKGYIFEEETFLHKPTFCVFDSGNLEQPISEKIILPVSVQALNK